ncbi:hypothetical protein [Acidovorax sp. Leaf160]|uniref:hypothetical protein n=1 Tax=Acidovorax sp. Leaf160 TaxID=1736280 RepID=UPI0012E39341|nr:hypothetical protein [Acidovorax sp. Leaf160]
MVQQHFALTQSHHGWNSFVDQSVMLLVVADAFVVAGAGNAFQHRSCLQVHGQLMEVHASHSISEGFHASVPVGGRQNTVVKPTYDVAVSLVHEPLLSLHSMEWNVGWGG